ncbi:MAG: diguanylate cyclase [Fibrobacteria bacterium]|nr:diguanylate cyclase [Fibrobacteria bacterium]
MPRIKVLSQKPARDIMIKDVVTVQQGVSLEHAANIMLRHRVGCLVVMEDEKPVGIVTERDFVNLISEGNHINKLLVVDDIMPSKLITITPSTPFSKAFSIINTNGIKRIPVVQNHKLKGLLTIRQILVHSRHTLISMLEENRLLEREAHRDVLTGLYNKRYLLLKLQEEFKRSQRYAIRTGIIFLDIDLFKKINDSYSHAAGDYALRQIGKILKKSVRATDIVTRYGGEEFVVITPSTKSFGAAYIANKIREAVSTFPFKFRKHTFSLTLSAGVCTFSFAQTAKQALNRSDNALYQAKMNGRNKVYRWRDSARKLVEAPYTKR